VRRKCERIVSAGVFDLEGQILDADHAGHYLGVDCHFLAVTAVGASAN
jgi:hypothetical protein